MSANTDDGDETRFYEIQDQSMSFKNAIITMIVFGLIGTGSSFCQLCDL